MNEKIMTREDVLNLVTGIAPRTALVDHFGSYCKTGALARFLMRYELYKKILPVHGSIIDCGTKSGIGLLTFHQLNKVLEPRNGHRYCYGFDTFTGLTAIDPGKDDPTVAKEGAEGWYSSPDDGVAFINLLAQIIQRNNFIAHHDDSNCLNPKSLTPLYPQQQVFTVAGDFMQTGPQFLKDNPHVVVALLYLDFDLYAPTKLALELFVPRMPRGSIIAFDELNHPHWPGETLALEETLGIGSLDIRRFDFEATVSYAVL